MLSRPLETRVGRHFVAKYTSERKRQRRVAQDRVMGVYVQAVEGEVGQLHC